jgi:hypothetical protein
MRKRFHTVWEMFILKGEFKYTIKKDSDSPRKGCEHRAMMWNPYRLVKYDRICQKIVPKEFNLFNERLEFLLARKDIF